MKPSISKNFRIRGNWTADYERVGEADRVGRLRSADAKTLDAFLRSKRPLVTAVARRLWNCGVPFDDLVQEGYLGLLEAMERYQSDGCKFDVFAVSRIRGRMLDAVRAHHAQPRSASKIWKAVNRLLQRKEGRFPSVAEISEESGTSARSIRAALSDGGPHLSLDSDESFSDGRHEWAWAYAVSVRDADERYSRLVGAALEALETAALTPKEHEVVAKYFGFSGNADGCTLIEIAHEFGVTESRVSQIRTAAIHKIRERAKEILG